MNGAHEAAKKGLEVGLAALRHAGWWLRWHTDRRASREAAELGALLPPTASVERPAA
jgi:hypothetical protein